MPGSTTALLCSKFPPTSGVGGHRGRQNFSAVPRFGQSQEALQALPILVLLLAAAAAVLHAVSLSHRERRGRFSFQALAPLNVLHRLLSPGRAVTPIPLLSFPSEVPSLV